MICSECGSYQPDRAKFCGICGAPLSQDGLVESFLRDEPEHDIVLPRYRSPWFYLAFGVALLLIMALLAGAGYLVYRVAWGEDQGEQRAGEVEDNTLEYENQDIGFSFSYPDDWTLEELLVTEGELESLKLSLSAHKSMEMRVYQLDPLVSIGGIEGIEEYLVDEATKRIRSLGGQPGTPGTTGTPDGQAGYGQGGATSPSDEGGMTLEGTGSEASADGMFTTTKVNGLPAFYTEFTANIMGEETRFLLYYIVAGDYLFLFQGRSPASEYKNVRPQFWSITGSLQWRERLEEYPETNAPGMSAGGAAPVTPCGG